GEDRIECDGLRILFRVAVFLREPERQRLRVLERRATVLRVGVSGRDAGLVGARERVEEHAAIGARRRVGLDADGAAIGFGRRGVGREAVLRKAVGAAIAEQGVLHARAEDRRNRAVVLVLVVLQAQVVVDAVQEAEDALVGEFTLEAGVDHEAFTIVL